MRTGNIPVFKDDGLISFVTQIIFYGKYLAGLSALIKGKM